MQIGLVVVGLALLLSACGGSGSGTAAGASSGDINLDEGNVTVLTEGQLASLTAAGGDTDSASVVSWNWSIEPINEGALQACAAVEGFDLQRAARRLGAACTSSDQCSFSFDQELTDEGDTRFDVLVPMLQAPIGLTYRLEALNSANQTTSANFTFCLLSINEPPAAGDDSFTALEGTALSVSGNPEVNLLSNDIDDLDVSNQPLFVNTTPVVAPTKATEFELRADGGFRYLYLGAADIPAGQSVRDSFVYEISDGQNTATATATINIVTVDKPPVPNGQIPNLSYTVGEEIEFNLAAFFKDPEGSRLVFTADKSTLPPSSDVELKSSGLLTGKAAVGDEGSYVVSFTVSDQVSASESVNAPLQSSVNIEILQNKAPRSTDIGNVEVIYGELVRMDLSQYFSDAENDPLVYRLKTVPATALKINSETGLMTGSLTIARDYEITVSVSDGYNPQVSESFILTQLPSPNTAPVLVNRMDHVEVVVNAELTPIVVEFSDPDGDELSYEMLTETPPGLSFNTETGVISGTPTIVADYRIRIRASDPEGLTALSNPFFIRVTSVPNEPPVSNLTIPDQQVIVNTPISPVSGMFTDADGDTLVYSISPVLPAGFVFNPVTGVLTGSPQEVGSTEFFLSATDGTETVDSNKFTIEVIPEPVVNTPPISGAATPNQTITLGEFIDPVIADFSDDEGDVLTFEISPAVNGTGLTFVNGELKGKPLLVGQETFTITASDGEFETSAAPFTITVEAGNTAPLAGSAVPDQSIILGESISPVVADFTDPEGDVLTFEISPDVAGSGLTFVDGVLAGTPLTPGQKTFTIIASDGEFATSGLPFTITVLPVVVPFNTPPVSLSVIANQEINLGEPIATVTPIFFDAEGHDLSYRIEPATLDPGLSFDENTGELSGTPQFIGEQDYVIIAIDSELAEGATNEFEIAVVDPEDP